jgi:hypothetical protein
MTKHGVTASAVAEESAEAASAASAVAGADASGLSLARLVPVRLVLALPPSARAGRAG